MGITDKAKEFLASEEAKKKARDAASQGVEKGGDMVDEKTGGKYASHVDKAQQKAAEEAEKRLGQ